MWVFCQMTTKLVKISLTPHLHGIEWKQSTSFTIYLPKEGFCWLFSGFTPSVGNATTKNTWNTVTGREYALWRYSCARTATTTNNSHKIHSRKPKWGTNKTISVLSLKLVVDEAYSRRSNMQNADRHRQMRKMEIKMSRTHKRFGISGKFKANLQDHFQINLLNTFLVGFTLSIPVLAS